MKNIKNEYICDICKTQYDNDTIEKMKVISVKMGNEDLYGNVPLGKVLISCKQGLIDHKDICPKCVEKILDECTSSIKNIINEAQTIELYDRENALSLLEINKALLANYVISEDGLDVPCNQKWIKEAEITTANDTINILNKILNSTLSDYNLTELKETIDMLWGIIASELLIIQTIARDGLSGIEELPSESNSTNEEKENTNE